MKSSKNSSKAPSKTASKPGDGIRLNRFLADCGLGSRRKTEALILAGEIEVNGAVCRDLAQRILPTDTVKYQGKTLTKATEKIYIVLNKPAGYVVSSSDEYGRKTVYDLLPEAYRHLPYAGRLDRNSEGLLLFSSEGDLINKLTHPSYEVEKMYKVIIFGSLNKDKLEQLRQGVMIEGGVSKAAGVYIKESSADESELKLVISEGRKRQIRQMIEAVGAKVKSLKRMQFGPLKLKDLPSGRWRLLSKSEINSLYQAVAPKIDNSMKDR
ncbi:MAG: pseudouridine synthase [Candidatus Cloacimonadaceae bacterium]